MGGMLMNERFVAAFPSLIRLLGPGSAIIVQHMHWRADADNIVRITQVQISEETGIPLRTVERALAWLREQGYVDARRTSQSDATLIYRINLEKISGGGTADVAGPTANVAVGGTADVADSSLEKEEEITNSSPTPTSSTPAHAEQRAELDPFKPIEHASRKVARSDYLSKSTGEWFLRNFREFDADDLRAYWADFIAYNVERGTVTKSVESVFLQYMMRRKREQKDKSKAAQEGVTDDMGRPLNQKPAPRGPAEPGDPDYVSPEELLAAALGAETIEETPREEQSDGS